jgi:hypothetical protein
VWLRPSVELLNFLRFIVSFSPAGSATRNMALGFKMYHPHLIELTPLAGSFSFGG